MARPSWDTRRAHATKALGGDHDWVEGPRVISGEKADEDEDEDEDSGGGRLGGGRRTAGVIDPFRNRSGVAGCH